MIEISNQIRHVLFRGGLEEGLHKGPGLRYLGSKTSFHGPNFQTQGWQDAISSFGI